MSIRPAVRDRLGDGNMLADEALARDLAAGEALARLDKVESDDDEFDELLAEIIPAVRGNLEFEEVRVWPQLRQALSPFQARELGDQLRDAAQRAAARLQPGAPARPSWAKAAHSGRRRRGQAEQRGHPAPGR